MSKSKFDELKGFIKGRMIKGDEFEAKGLLAEIYCLFQEDIISEDQEEELYNLVDPDNKYHAPADYWYSGDYSDVTVWQFVEYEL